MRPARAVLAAALATVLIAQSTPSVHASSALEVVPRAKQVTRHVVTDASLVTLTSRGTVVYGGTSIAGGLPTTPPTRKHGAGFAYDAAAGKKLWETEIAGASMVSSVTLGPDGLLWGVGGNTVTLPK